MVSVKRSPTVAPSVVPRLLAKSAAAAEIVASEVEAVVVGGAVVESPSKRKLRMSVSCDNYLGDGKFSLCRRDSVGSGSPHSSKVKIQVYRYFISEGFFTFVFSKTRQKKIFDLMKI